MSVTNGTRTILDAVEASIGPRVIIALLARIITRKVVIQILDDVLGYMEEKAEHTETKVDDAFLRYVRRLLDSAGEEPKPTA